MKALNWQDRLKVIGTALLIKTGKLPYDKFTEEELNALLPPHFPIDIPLPLPVVNAHVELQEGRIKMNGNSGRLTLQTLAAIQITAVASTLYRAHLMISISAAPVYNQESCVLGLEHIRVDSINMVNDEYALIMDAQFIMETVLPLTLPKSMGRLFSSPIIGALNIVSGSTGDLAKNYFGMYMEGSKQRVLDYHRPQIEAALLDNLSHYPTEYVMREDHWREYVFSRWGKQVVVEESELRFLF